MASFFASRRCGAFAVAPCCLSLEFFLASVALGVGDGCSLPGSGTWPSSLRSRMASSSLRSSSSRVSVCTVSVPLAHARLHHTARARMLGFCKELFVRFVVNVVHELEFLWK